MVISDKFYTVKELCEGFVYSESEGKGLFGLNGKLIIQPEYQREYLYSEKNGKKEIAVIDSVINGIPLGVLYFNKREDGMLEVLDGQQRITSLGRFLTNKFSIKINGREHKFDMIADKKIRDRILNTKILVYECVGSDTEIKQWFKIINIGGIKINEQEELNAVYSGPFVTLARAEFSNSQNSNVQKWSHFITADVKRQGFLECALDWISDGDIEGYMRDHRFDDNIDELKNHFNDVIAWTESVFDDLYDEMAIVKWGQLYKRFHNNAYNHSEISARVRELMADDDVGNKKNVFEFVLGGEQEHKLLNIRVFDKHTKDKVYTRQTDEAKAKNVSNCPLCAIGNNANKTRIWEKNEMEADHVTAWSKGGNTDISNCQMLCIAHNRAKGNK